MSTASYVHVTCRVDRLTVWWAGHIGRVVVQLGEGVDAHLRVEDAVWLADEFTAAVRDSRNNGGDDR